MGTDVAFEIAVAILIEGSVGFVETGERVFAKFVEKSKLDWIKIIAATAECEFGKLVR